MATVVIKKERKLPPGGPGEQIRQENKVIAEIVNTPGYVQRAAPALPAGENVLGISNSEITTFTGCPRRWFLHYYLGYQPDPGRSRATSTSLLGVRGHVALQGYYGHGLDPLAVVRAIYAMEAERRPEAGDDLRKEFDMLVTILEGYAEWLDDEHADRGLVPVAAEQQVAWPLQQADGYDIWLRATLDTILYDQHSGKYRFMDHKFVDAYDTLATLTIDPQMKTYVMTQRLLAGADGTRADGGYFNMLKKVKRTGRAQPPFYKRVPVAYNDADMNSMWLRTLRVTGQIARVRRELDVVFRDPSSGELDRTLAQQWLVSPVPQRKVCYWACQFFSQCALLDDGSRWEDALAGTFIQGDPYAYYGRGMLEELRAQGRL